MSLISIIVPVYNVKKYLSQCLDSILKQTFQDFEVICVNDGSTDNSLDILQEYQQKDKRVRIFSKRNGGISSARNYGLKKAKGEYICFLDSDDFLHKEFLNTLYAEIHNVDVVACNYISVQNDAKIKDENISSYKSEELETINYFSLSKDVSLTAWGKLYKKKAITGFYFNENCSFSEDVLFHADVFAQRLKLKVIDQPLIYYRDNPNSLIHKKTSVQKILSLLLVAEYVSNKFKFSKLYPQIYKNRVSKSLSNALKYISKCDDKLAVKTKVYIKIRQLYQNKNIFFRGLSWSKKITLFRILYW